MGLFDFNYNPMFDFNHDGKNDFFERAAEFEFIDRITKEENSDDSEYDDMDDELEMAGLDRDDLEMMDEDERREALEEAGLDPDDFDDF